MTSPPETLVGAHPDREIVVTRRLPAGPEQVWSAWTDPAALGAWWGPEGFSTTTHSYDLRPGGAWRFTMHGPDGRDYSNHVVFDEVTPAERLVYRHVGGEDAEPVTFHTTVTFAAEEAGTRLTLRMVFPSAAERARVEREYGAVAGGIETVGRLSSHLAGDSAAARGLTVALPSETGVVLQRVFDAPRELVFAAFSRPEHIRRWWGCGAFAMTACEMDFRVGGTWRFVQAAPDGAVHPFCGEYLAIEPPERIVQTFVYDVEGIRNHVATETLTLTERPDGTTVLHISVRHASQASRDGHLNSGMERGAAASMQRLAELCATLRHDTLATEGARA